METPQSRKTHKGGKVVRTEPVDMHLFDTEPMAREVFQRVGCLSFCQNMQRGHPEVARQFALHFDGRKTKVGDLEFEVTEASISAATGIPITGEKWFKAMALSSAYAKDLFKPEYQANDLSKSMPRSQLIEQFDRILKIIQRYFTCEGRFNTLYQYHVRLLLHFTGKVEMNIPYYLLRSIGKMSDRIQAKSKDVDSSLFHSGLIRMLVSEELGKKEISWEHFVVTSHFKLDLASTPQSQKASPLSPTSATKAGTSRKRKSRASVQVSEVSKQVTGAEEEVCPSPQRDFSPPPPPGLEEVPSSTKATSKKGKKLLFPSSPPAVEIKGKRPFTRSSIPKEAFKEQSLPETPIQKKKGKSIENPVEEKQEAPVQKGKGKGTKIPLERKDETSVKYFEKPVERKEETPVQRKKGKSKATKKPDEVDKTLPMQVEEETEKKPLETVHNTAPPDSQTFKRLIRQLKDARKEVAQLKKEAMSDRAKMTELMDGYSHTLDLARFAARRAQPLHRQLKNLYRQNRGFQSQNRKLKAELKHFQDEVAQRNLQVLVEAAIENDKPTVKESTTSLKNPVTAKKKKSVVSIEDPLSTRKSVRLSVKMTK
jgi:hypothetical protein